MLQCHAFQKLHRDVGLLATLADFVNRADVGMVECRCGTGFTPETFQCLRVLRDILGKELESYEATKVGVFGLVDHAHTAAAELFDDAVVRDGLADQCCRAMLGGMRGQVNECRCSYIAWGHVAPYSTTTMRFS